MSYENKILQMKKMLGKKTEKVYEKPTFQKPDRPTYCEQWQQAGLELVENDFGVLFKRVVHYPLDYQHGSYELGQLYDAIERWEMRDEDHPYALNFDETLVFFDTETTGLKGVGTHIFLLGLLEAHDDGFVLTQYVMADPSNEAAMLFESKFWQRVMTIISYNGKSFDWPQLETRWTLNQQMIPKLRTQRQIDLLHSTKRLWKDDLDGMKLTKVEQEKLGFTRVDDIPGHLAPIIYFDAVKSGKAETLMKVLLHNEWDLLSLITLYVHSTKLLLDELGSESATTYTNIGKWYGDLKQKQTSADVLVNVTEQFMDDETGLAHFYLAYEQKRNGQYNKAAYSFAKAVHTTPPRKQAQAYEQLAMIYEHQLNDVKKSYEFAMKGKEVTRAILYPKIEHQHRQLAAWDKRIQRLKNKLHFLGHRK